MALTTVQKTNNRIVFMGTSDFAVPVLHGLIEAGRVPVLVVTQPDRPQGRKLLLTPSPVKRTAELLGLRVFQPENVNDHESVEAILGVEPDLVITASYGGFLGKCLRDAPRFGCLNLHPSLLPLYRGAAPVPFTLFDGRTETGVSVFRLVKRMDAGPILVQWKAPIEPDENATHLLQRMAVLGTAALLAAIDSLEDGSAQETSQDDATATYTVKIGKEDLLLDWRLPATALVNRIRGLALDPGATTRFRDRGLKILAAGVLDETSGNKPGTLLEIVRNRGFKVACGTGSVLVTQVQPEGKKVMDGFAFTLGARPEIGEVFGE
jgi:methionyl-tRNA formyltransferase